MQFFKDINLTAVTAGFVAVLVGFTSSVALVFQATQALHATPEQTASWMWALGLGMGLCTLLPSLWLRKPVMVSWSTPGAAVVATAAIAGGFSMAEAVGAFMVSAALIALCGVTGWFEKIMDRIPMAIAAALLAGVLARFGLNGFAAAQSSLPLVVLMLAVYLLARRWWPRFAIILTLLGAIFFTALRGDIAGASLVFSLAKPVFVTPVFSWAATVGMALPLFVVTMASQNLPGVAALRAAGYAMPISRLITLTGVATMVLAPWGGYALCLSSITAAICMGPEAHADKAKRYTAAAACGIIYVIIGIFGAAITGLLGAFPHELIAAIAGLALLGTIGGALATALHDIQYREAATITFLVTLSGVVIAGIGSAFWGVIAGTLALLVQQYRRP